MTVPTMLTAVLLIVIGVMGYANAEPNAETGKVSPTALIPAFFGLAIGILGGLALQDSLRKHAMHLAAVLGLLGVVGGFMPLIRQNSKGLPFDPLAPAALSGLLMSVVCAVFVGLCVKSFIDAKKARLAAAAAAAGPAA